MHNQGRPNEKLVFEALFFLARLRSLLVLDYDTVKTLKAEVKAICDTIASRNDIKVIIADHRRYAAACVYMACRSHRVPCTLSDVSRAAMIATSKIWYAVTRITRITGVTLPPPPPVDEVIEAKMRAHGYTNGVIEDAKSIYRRLAEKHKLSGRSPNVIGALILSCMGEDPARASAIFNVKQMSARSLLRGLGYKSYQECLNSLYTSESHIAGEIAFIGERS